MAKIDTGKIDGYAEMTPEQKLAALEAFDIPEEKPQQTDDSEINRLKALLSKSNSEAADWKRQLREKQTEDERKEAERAEAEQALKDQLAQLTREKTIATYAASYSTLGYTAEQAKEAAEAMASNDYAKVFAIQQQVNTAREEALKAELMKTQPQLQTGLPADAEQQKTAEYEKLKKYFGL